MFARASRCRVRVNCGGESRVQQQFKDQCDIRQIMAKCRAAGTRPIRLDGALAKYGDFSNAVDYQEAVSRVAAANSLFEQLPGKVRRRFENDPALMVEFLADPENREEAEELGLVAKKDAGDAPREAGGTGHQEPVEPANPGAVTPAAGD